MIPRQEDQPLDYRLVGRFRSEVVIATSGYLDVILAAEDAAKAVADELVDIVPERLDREVVPPKWAPIERFNVEVTHAMGEARFSSEEHATQFQGMLPRGTSLSISGDPRNGQASYRIRTYRHATMAYFQYRQDAIDFLTLIKEDPAVPVLEVYVGDGRWSLVIK